ncbi:hypothetical protein ACRAWF_21175 [Streptomyces sp. L7]
MERYVCSGPGRDGGRLRRQVLAAPLPDGGTAAPSGRGSAAASHQRFPQFPRNTRELTIPASVAPARATVYLPAGEGPPRRCT